MKALRIILTQNKAHYKKEEVDQNKLTYPLPPFSTVIGAIHNACGFKDYQEMNLSIQGEYQSLSKQAYTDHCFLDSTQDDRGILVKLADGNFQSRAFEKVAQAKRGQGNSFKQGITIDVYNQMLLDEYRTLKDLNDQLAEFKKNKLDKILSLIGKRKKTLKEKKKKFINESDEFKGISSREDEIKSLEKMIKDSFEKYKQANYTTKISKFQTLTTSLKYYEVLHEVILIIHIQAEEKTLKAINENIYNLRAIGRSEDFVDVKECMYVELQEKFDDELERTSYSAYLNYNLVKNRHILLNKRSNNIPASGTKYWINKKYDRLQGYRKFEKVKVLYASNFYADEESEGVFFDGEYIVNFN